MNKIKSIYAFCKLIKKAEKAEVDINAAFSLWEKWREANRINGYLDENIKDEERRLIEEVKGWFDFIYAVDVKPFKHWSWSKRFKNHLPSFIFSFLYKIEKIKRLIKDKRREKKLIGLKGRSR